MSLCHSDAGCRDALSELAFPPQVSGLFMVDICCWELVVCQGMHVGSPQYVEENAEKKEMKAVRQLLIPGIRGKLV